MESYITVANGASAEYTEKRSRFIAQVFFCDSEQMASDIIAAQKKKYFDAKHNVYAYILKDNTARFSDDGEPKGTAAKPILDVIEGSKIVNVLIVVTRYFGGTLLGTGGLVRAYSTCAGDALNNAELCEMCPCVRAKIECSYSNYNSLQVLLSSYDCEISGTAFEANTTVEFLIKSELFEAFCEDLREKFASRLMVQKIKEEYFAVKIKK